MTLTLPEFTADQLAKDAIRGYNGWAGDDDFGHHLHKFRVKVDTDGNLVVTELPGGTAGVCVLGTSAPADRPGSPGDPKYVTHVLNQMVYSPRFARFFPLLALVAGCQVRGEEVLYLYGCGGQLLRLDAAGRHVTGKWDLQTQFQSIVPAGNRDGCYLNGLLYDRASARLITVTPKSPSVNADDTREYLLVSATLPGMKVAASVALPVKTASVPQLESKDGNIAITWETGGAASKEMMVLYAAADLHQVHGPSVVPAGNDGISSNPKFALAKEVASAGSLRLLAFPQEPDHQRRFSVVREGSAQVSATFIAPSTSVKNVHLSLDGRRALVEELSPDRPRLTGRLLVYDIAGQRQIGSLNATGLARSDAHFICMSPSLDEALYALDRRLDAVSLTDGDMTPLAPGVAVDKTYACVVADR